MKKIILTFISIIFYIFFTGIAFGDVSYTISSGDSYCDTSTNDSTDSNKWVPVSNTSGASTSGTVSCESHGYFRSTGGRTGRISKGTFYSCDTAGYTDGFVREIEYSGNNFRIYCMAKSDNFDEDSGITHCDYSTNNDTNGQKKIPITNDSSAVTVGALFCEQHGYWRTGTSGRSPRIAEGTFYSCDNVFENGYVRYIEYSGTNFRIYCMQVDDTPPTASDITFASQTDYEASTSSSYLLTVNDGGGAPIASAGFNVENPVTTGSDISHTGLTPTSVSGDDYYFEENINIWNVDSDRETYGGREYSLNVTSMCDEAGNCFSGSAPTDIYVYANSQDSFLHSTNATTTSSSLTSGNFADGTTEYPLIVELYDIYSNDIIPATGIGRTLDINFFNVTNTTNLDHYSQTGDAVFVTTPNDSTYNNDLPGGNKSFNSLNSSDGTYTFDFKIYNAIGNTVDEGVLDISSITYDVNQGSSPFANNIGSTVPDSTNIEFDFAPIYTTLFEDDQADYGLVLGATQEGNISLVPQGSGVSPSTNIYIEYGYISGTSHLAHPTLNLEYQKTTPWYDVVEGHQSSISSTTNYGTTGGVLNTQLNQYGVLSDSDLDTYLSSHIGFTIDGKDIVYNSDVLGMDSYWGTVDAGDNTHQYGANITGIIHSDKESELYTGQSTYVVLGNLDKSYLQRDIRQATYETIKNLTTTTSGYEIDSINSNTDGYDSGDILYFGDLGGTIVDLDLGTGLYTGSKTIVIEGGDLYIQSDILATNKNTDILGIIVLKDEDGNGGNIYLDPSVVEIDAILFADKSLLSYDGSQVLSPDNGGTYTVLSNQIYIYGSLFSNNTIGGSVQTPYLCPYYITETCDLDTAQKYDLNYLRRAYLGGNYITTYPYPVVIDYNPLIQLTPPPLFSE